MKYRCDQSVVNGITIIRLNPQSGMEMKARLQRRDGFWTLDGHKIAHDWIPARFAHKVAVRKMQSWMLRMAVAEYECENPEPMDSQND